MFQLAGSEFMTAVHVNRTECAAPVSQPGCEAGIWETAAVQSEVALQGVDVCLSQQVKAQGGCCLVLLGSGRSPGHHQGSPAAELNSLCWFLGCWDFTAITNLIAAVLDMGKAHCRCPL